ncbi:MAG: ABC transporter permease [Deinococcota bacterium]|nr:ABC transporter permease [Deinococcota bacterium]
MFPFIVRRLIHLIPTFLGATLLAFFITQLVPGDFFVQRSLEPNVRPETLQMLRERFALDQPAHVQYVRWMGNLLRGDLGMSFDSNQPVINLIRRPIQNSMILVVISLILLYVMAIPLGVYSAVRQYSLGDQVVSTVSYFGLAIPNFFFALVLILLIFYLRGFTREVFDYNQLLFPVAQMTSNNHQQLSAWGRFWDIMWHAIIPAFVVATSGIAGFTRILRGQMLEFLQSDFIRTARAKGLNERAVTYKHSLRPALIPFVAGIGGLLPALIGGAGLVEIVFAWPGITPILLSSISRQDIYVVLAFLIVSSLLLMVGNLISDLLLAVVDPRIRYS